MTNMNKFEIICGDSHTELKKIESDSIDTIITSPPYNLAGFRGHKVEKESRMRDKDLSKGIKYDNFDDNLPEPEYQKQQIKIINECMRILKPSGSFFYQHKIRRHVTISHPLEWIFKTQASIYQEIIWNRSSTPAAHKGLLYPITERIYWLVKDKPAVYKHRCYYKTDIWPILPEFGGIHPVPFPVQLPENCVLLTTPKNGIVLDPFCGSGTTGVACILQNRRFIGIDLSQKYCDLSRQRFESLNVVRIYKTKRKYIPDIAYDSSNANDAYALTWWPNKIDLLDYFDNNDHYQFLDQLELITDSDKDRYAEKLFHRYGYDSVDSAGAAQNANGTLKWQKKYQAPTIYKII